MVLVFATHSSVYVEIQSARPVVKNEIFSVETLLSLPTFARWSQCTQCTVPKHSRRHSYSIAPGSRRRICRFRRFWLSPSVFESGHIMAKMRFRTCNAENIQMSVGVTRAKHKTANVNFARNTFRHCAGRACEKFLRLSTATEYVKFRSHRQIIILIAHVQRECLTRPDKSLKKFLAISCVWRVVVKASRCALENKAEHCPSINRVEAISRNSKKVFFFFQTPCLKHSSKQRAILLSTNVTLMNFNDVCKYQDKSRWFVKNVFLEITRVKN